MAVTEVMHDPERRPIPDREEQAPLSRGGACLVCGEWVDSGAADAFLVQVTNPPRAAEYACHEACFERVKHASLPSPA